jgi:hypothetical protein
MARHRVGVFYTLHACRDAVFPGVWAGRASTPRTFAPVAGGDGAGSVPDWHCY